MIHTTRPSRVWLCLSWALMLVGCGGGAPVPADSRLAANAPRRGGEATVLLTADYAGSWPAGLDPATNITGGANLSLMNAIYGGLVQLTADPDGRNPRVIGVLAQSVAAGEGGRTVIFHLRQGVTFSDGTPFDAEAVRFNFERSLGSLCSCNPIAWPWARQDRVRVLDDHTIELRFSQPYGPAINAFPSTNLNWIASPTALRKLGEERFKITPVGAGPFQVVSDEVSTKLVLERNPRYWQQGRPYLDRLTFQPAANDQVAYQALLAGDARAYEGITTPPLIQQAESNRQLRITRQPATSPLVVQLNTQVAPFNDPRAREAIYYATDVEAIRIGLFHGVYPASQSFTAPGGLFHHDRIDGYRTFDLAKARQIVREIGGLRINLGTLRVFVPTQVITALQSQWQAAGIQVTLHTYDLGTLIAQFQGGKWQAMLQTAGSYDPDAGAGLKFRFSAGTPFSGVSDPELDRLIGAAAGTVDPVERDKLYLATARLISDKAYAPFLVAQEPAQLTRGLYGPGLTTRIPPILINPGILWQDVWVAAD